MPWWGWVLVVAGGWIVLAPIVGLIVGRVIRNRDRQDPTEPSRSQIEAFVQSVQKYAQRRQVSRPKMLDMPPGEEERHAG